MRLIRVTAPYFVAGYETDGIVRHTAPALRALRGMTDQEAEIYLKLKRWRATTIAEGPLVALSDREISDRISAVENSPYAEVVKEAICGFYKDLRLIRSAE